MNSFFSFRCSTSDFPHRDAVLVIFSGPYAIDADELKDEVAKHTKNRLSPDAVFIIGAQRKFDGLIRNKSDLQDALLPVSKASSICLFEYNESGSISLKVEWQGNKNPRFDESAVRRQGLTELFRRRDGLIEAGPTAHFLKPSGRRDSRFLRAAHALSEGVEIFFTALWLLQKLRKDTGSVHLDTSGISNVVMAALIMASRPSIPIVSTFHSYERLETHEIRYDHHNLVVISASQSGGMVSKAKQRYLPSDTIITLFALIDDQGDDGVLCDLRWHEDYNPYGYHPAKSGENFAGTRPIELVSEHFLAKKEEATPVIPGKKDAPDVVEKLLGKLSAKAIFSVLIDDAVDGQPAVKVDFERLARSSSFDQWLSDVVLRFIPTMSRGIIYDPSNAEAAAMTVAIRAKLQDMGEEREIPLIPLREAEEKRENFSLGSRSAYLVVEGSSSSGDSLLAGSRALRSYAENSHRIYLSGSSITPTVQAFEILKSNLIFPKHQAEFMFNIAIKADIITDSWKRERVLLENSTSLPDLLSVRLKMLSQNTHLAENLFLPSFGQPLKLRPNFAFWPKGTDCEDASQGDIITTIGAILENMRSGSAMGRLTNDIQSHTVIAAETFARYNDGIIQASLLRSAHSTELNYLSSESESSTMSIMIEQMINLFEKPQAEALNEFLLAFLVGRLRIQKSAREKIFEALRRTSLTADPISTFLAEKVLLADLTIYDSKYC